MEVYKFGGASVNSARAVKNAAAIVQQHLQEPLVVVVSAMGKTTNALEQLVPGVEMDSATRERGFQALCQYHTDIVAELFPEGNAQLMQQLQHLFAALQQQMAQPPTQYNFDYDQMVSYGELLSTTILSAYLTAIGVANTWVDVRTVIRTDATYREGRVDWPCTCQQATDVLLPAVQQHGVVVTQGFIAGTGSSTTTLGREGSDYSAAILSYVLNAKQMTIWKDVPGFLNADPKYFHDTVKMARIPYNEAIELAYYGASVIHPKTVQPIQNKNIPLHIKSFLTPETAGSVVGPFPTIEPQTPLYIFKNDQVLISILPRDFSFIVEDSLQTIFSTLAQLGVRVNLMQNSALSFSLCVDHDERLLQQLRECLGRQFLLRYNEGLQLITIRYYTQQIIDAVVGGRPVLLQQRSRTTTQLVVAELL